MAETASAFLAPWSTFYVMVGSAAAALTGLMFVVITLVTRIEHVEKRSDGIATFSTPIVVHFGAALLVSMILSAPWHLLLHPAVLVGCVGAGGLAYLSRVTNVVKRLAYEPDFEDWTWYTVIPFLGYGALLAGAIMLLGIPVKALFVLAAGAALLIFAGIRNAWDIVTYIAIGLREGPPG